MNLPAFESYGDYSSSNYGVNSLKFVMPNITIYYRYKTPVAFRTWETGLVIRQNDWNTTTGKHLNWIDNDHSKRISGLEFEELLAKHSV